MIEFPSTKAEAAKIGSPFFINGKSCLRGHTGERYTKGGQCVACIIFMKQGHHDARQRSAENAVRAKSALAFGQTTFIPDKPCKHGHLLRFIASNNCVACDKVAAEKYKIDRKYARIKKVYDLSKEQYHALLESQNGQCVCCNKKPDDHFSLHIDHCHKTKKVRGLLCMNCNQAIGLLKENISVIKNILGYLNDNS